MAYVFCNQCGHRNPPDSGFCSSCGGTLEHSDDHTITFAKVDPLQDAVGPADDIVVNVREIPTASASLVVRNGPHAGAVLPLEAAVTRLGRTADCEIVLDDITVSRWHAEVHRNGDDYRVRDAGSLNGTYVNHDRIETAPLAQGDELQVGKFRMVFFEKGDG
ncbi:MAG: FHA domain-containing protein [Actinobacteria bacterium]|nr:FHA domain-containing protein [Actinomycetota bacterium]